MSEGSFIFQLAISANVSTKLAVKDQQLQFIIISQFDTRLLAVQCYLTTLTNNL